VSSWIVSNCFHWAIGACQIQLPDSCGVAEPAHRDTFARRPCHLPPCLLKGAHINAYRAPDMSLDTYEMSWNGWFDALIGVATEEASHGCPVRSRIESVGCLGRANRFGNRTLEVPVKWAFSRKA
jgi:hypothetical protein